MSEEQVKSIIGEGLGFRFAFIFFTLFAVLFNPLLPWSPIITSFTDKAVIWLANEVLGFDYNISIGRGTGSGDTLYHYLILLLIVLIATAGSVVWSLLERKKNYYIHLNYWLNVLVRYYLALTLIHYGLVKIIKLQFTSPDLIRLLTPYGDSSPMGLAWTFLGFSDGYNIFMGIAELSAGLLFFRRTATLGALICVIVCANVLAINYFFDVPVKILSTMLLLMSLFLLAPNFQRLIKLFINGETVKLKAIEMPLMNRRWLTVSKTFIKYIIIIAPITYSLYAIAEQSKYYGDGVPKLPLYGVYNVESFESERAITKWEKLVVQRKQYSAVVLEGNDMEFCDMKVDTTTRQLTIAFKEDPKILHRFEYVVVDSDHLDLKGTYFDQAVNIKLKRQHFELMERTFNWVSEDPYNR